MVSSRRAITTAAALAAFAWPPTGPLQAQSGRIWGTSSLQYVEVRPLLVDSVLESGVQGDGLLRSLPGGAVVRCIAGEEYCRFSRSGSPLHTVPSIHDVSATAWGFARGVRVYTRFLVRGEVAGEEGIWPRADDNFDLVLAFAEWNRRRVQVRAGRQWKASGLGYHNYDGASVRLRPTPTLQAEVYGGWSLARGLNEPRTGSALSAIEPFAPDDRALIVGVEASWRPSPRGALTGLYQREVRSDRKGLISERVALDGLYRTGRVTVEGAFEADLPSRAVNEALLRARIALPRGFGGEAWLRRYRPFFELWTIWGAFSPVAYGEVGLGGRWNSPTGALGVALTGSRRKYGDTDTNPTFGGARSSSWRVSALITGRLAERWSAQGRYGADVGFGAASSSGGVRVQWSPGEASHLGASLEAFQTDYEFRVQEGTVLGVGADGGLRIADRTALRGGLTVYRHAGGSDELAGPDWSQLRAHLRLEWSVGPYAGTTVDSGGRR